MSTILDRAHLARRAGRVQRFHTQYLARPETVADHTFGVVNLLMIMTNGQITSRLLMAAIQHDMGEYISGDVPSPVKRLPGVRENINALEHNALLEIYPDQGEDITEWEYMILKACDNLDGLLKCIEEKRMGNYTIEVCGNNYAEYLSAHLQALGGGPAAELVQLALTEWHWSHK